ncbi:MAG: glycoside hydrolase family 99-like domain-containing protein [Tannerella sp.]|jgi:hypothetical protein|nr:glycoside hydrolase family 99-like domain-containing protein [Tannerella sp.]
MTQKARVIAFYLPQFYPTDINNKWYGNGFTEWTNVRKAKPLFKGHYQPRIPTDLGYYDLRYPDTRQHQAQLAEEAGIEGFCYYHYWFGEGRRELEIPFNEILRLGKPDFPFCLCWANQSWYSKFWNKDTDREDKLIIEQLYDSPEWVAKHFYSLLAAFRDSRYIKVDGKLLFMIYRPLEYPDIKKFIAHWRLLAMENQLNDFYFVGQAVNEAQASKILELGLDGVNIVRMNDFLHEFKYNNLFIKAFNKLQRFLQMAPYHYDYKKISKYFIKPNGMELRENVFPTLIPNWDHSPRSGKSGLVFYDSTPENFSVHLSKALNIVENKPDRQKIIFLKSWNEWGEGNYIEPDLKYGKGFLKILRIFLSNN